MSLREDVARQLVERRIALGMSQNEFSRRSGVSQSTISRIEAGTGLTVTTLERLAAALDAQLIVTLELEAGPKRSR